MPESEHRKDGTGEINGLQSGRYSADSLIKQWYQQRKVEALGRRRHSVTDNHGTKL